MIYIYDICFLFCKKPSKSGFPEMVFKFGSFLVQKVAHTISYFNKETENIKMVDNVQMWHWTGRTESKNLHTHEFINKISKIVKKN